ncbi:Pentatricopeptide repeat-containing protein [Heracleum sosnowskyi]|uniref:Pentatricopeptide repeat-containing protein n=1 Tax=Heracleum sosnowskyi TaxID=360622 RepID=A0AAD8M7F1_9APIA|nr:Pentatricopeptide repeat-containing protein [Heracleum sosnowskyi]
MRKHASDPNPVKALTFFQDMVNLDNPSSSIFDPFVFASLIKACNRIGALREGKAVQCYVIKVGLDCNVYVLNSLIHFYLDCGKLLNYARVLFDTSCERNVVTFNCMVSGYMKAGDFRVGLSLFVKLLRGGFGLILKPNYVTLVILVSGCVEFGEFYVGNVLHSYCCKTGLDLNKEVCNVLIDYYSKCGCIREAERVFSDSDKDLVSWNTMITGYAKSGDSRKAFALYRKMRKNNIALDRVTLIGLITACAKCRDRKVGNVIHGYAKVWGMDNTVAVGTALINMYSKCGLIQYARKLFEQLPKQFIDSWNSMIHGYVECGLNNEALDLFTQIESQKLKADEVTMLGLILACRNSGEMHAGCHIHSYIESNSYLTGSTRLCNALIDLYAKCGSMTRAKRVFDAMPNRDVISWTSIIMGYALNGEVEEALVAFKHMDAEKIAPNSITFLGVLLACNHAGWTEAGSNLYAIMQKVYQIEPTIEHYGCMVDMNARAGLLGNAHQFVKKMSIEPNAIIWRMLMNSCRVHNHSDLLLNIVNALDILKTSSDPEDHVLFSNFFAEAEKWDDVLHQRSVMRVQEASKVAGKSSPLIDKAPHIANCYYAKALQTMHLTTVSKSSGARRFADIMLGPRGQINLRNS